MLALGAAVTREIKGDAAHHYGVKMEAGQYARLSVRKRGVDLLAVVTPPGRFDVTSHENPAGLQSPLNLTIMAGTAGVHAVEVRPVQKRAAAGLYEIQLEVVRAPHPEDQKRHAAAQMVAEGRRQQLLDTRESLDAAVVSYDNAASLYKELGDRFEEANALHFLAETNGRRSALGEKKELRATYFRDASNIYAEAIEVRQLDGDRQAEAYTRLGWAVLSPLEEKGGLPRHEKALALFREGGNRRGQAAAFYAMGIAMANMQNWSAAVEYYLKALAVYGDAQDGAAYDRHEEARTLQAIGGAYGDWQKPDEAISFYQRALEGWRETGDIVQEGNTYNSLAVLEEGQGRFQTALDQYRAALDKYKQAEASAGRDAASIRRKRAVTLYNLADTYAAIFGDYAKALELFDESLKHREDARGKGRTFMMMGLTHVLAGEPQKALESCRKALPLQEEAGDPRRSQTYTVTGMAHAALGDHKSAHDYYKRALEIQQNKQRPDPGGEAITQYQLGEMHAALGDHEAALAAYAGARRLWREGGRNGEALALYGMARVEGRRNNLTSALEHVEEALKVVEPLRASLNSQQLRSSYFAARVDYYGLYIDLKMRMREPGNSAALTAAAFEASEHARSRGLLDILSEARVEAGMKSDPELAALADRHRRIQSQIRERKVHRGQAAGAGQGSADADAELSRLYAERDRAEEQIRTRYPRYAALMYPQPLKAAEVQRLLDEDTLLLEFSLGDERSYVWALTSTELAGGPLPPRSEIEATARRLLDLLRSGQPVARETAAQRRARMRQAETEYWSQAATFSRTLLGQVSPMLKKKKRLLVVADGQLLYFPFAALPHPDAHAAPDSVAEAAPRYAPLVGGYEIVSLPSASVLSVLRQTVRRVPASKSVAIFADPVFERDDPRLQSAGRRPADPATPEGREAVGRAWRDVGDASDGTTLQRLPASLAEARGIVSMVPPGSSLEAIGFKANRENATSEQLSRYRVVHFATHGILNEKNPELSGVVLSLYDEQGRFREDGFLHLRDIYGLSLPVDLVVLSACRTGLGKEVRGEGLIGLTRGFMYAGSPRVVASLWKVDDDATAELMTGFYEKMLKGGMTPAAALRAAQAAMSGQRRWSHPYYWAGFIMQGEPR
jgi:CHAT domain-containing protein/tetratricopeptide (TPR) repeat protein